MKIKLVLAWYDCWVGAYWDKKGKWLYIMIPFVGVKIRWLHSLTQDKKRK
jgi:hypothetical protein